MSTLSESMQRNPVAYFSGVSVPLTPDVSEEIIRKFLERFDGSIQGPLPRIEVTVAHSEHAVEENALIEALAQLSEDVYDANPDLHREDIIEDIVQCGDDPAAFIKYVLESSQFSVLLSAVREPLQKLLEAERKSKEAQIGSEDEPIVDDNAFIQLVANGNLPVVRPLPGLEDELPAINAFLCAKCVYQSYLFMQNRSRLLEVVEKIKAERLSIDSKRQSYRDARLKVETKVTPMMRILVEKQAVLQHQINTINEMFRELLAPNSPIKTPFKLWIAITKKPDSAAGITSLNYSKRVSAKYEAKLDEQGMPFVNFKNVTDSYEQLCRGGRLLFSQSTVDQAKFDICYGAKDMIDAGVEDHIRHKFYRMATSFAISPVTMFGTMAMNIALMGAPGTGKSTLAKKIGEFAHAVGWLTSNGVQEPKPSDLISNVRGQTAIQTRAFLNASLGQMCFIDEAYALTPPGDAAGKEFADELTEFLTNHKGMVMVMVAGYVKEMTNDFFSSNIGLPRRFPTKIILGEKTPKDCFHAFMLHVTDILGKESIGAINVHQFSQAQIPFFLVQASIWIPVFNILLGKRFKVNEKTGLSVAIEDDPTNLLDAYFSDVRLIAEIYCRYLMSEGLFHKTIGDSKYDNGQGSVNPQTPFNIASIVANVLNDWLSTKNNCNTFVSDVGAEGVGNSIVPYHYFPYDDAFLNQCGLNVFKNFMNDPVGNGSAAILKARTLLDSRVCVWPVTLSNGDNSLYFPNVTISVSFRVKNLGAPGKVPFSAAYSWYVRKSVVASQLSSSNGTAPNADILVERAKQLRKRQQTERIINQYHKEQQEQVKRMTEIADKMRDISTEPIAPVNPDHRQLNSEISRLESELAKLTGPERRDLEHRLETARSREADLRDKIRELEEKNNRAVTATPKTRWKEKMQAAVNKINNPKFEDVVKDWTKRCSTDGLWKDLHGTTDQPWLTKPEFKKKLSEKVLEGCLGDKLLPTLSKEERSAFLDELFDEMDVDPKDPTRLTKKEFKQYILNMTKKKTVSRETPEEKEKREKQARKEKIQRKLLERGGFRPSNRVGKARKKNKKKTRPVAQVASDIHLVF